MNLALKLKDESIEGLRRLARRFLEIDAQAADAMDRNQLISELSKRIGTSTGLTRALSSRSVKLKPSFYLMTLSQPLPRALTTRSLRASIRPVVNSINVAIKEKRGVPSRKSYQLTDLEIHDDGTVECHYTWQSVIWYWAPETVTLTNIYELNFGFVLVDPASNKAIISCHTVEERDALARSVAEALSIKMGPLVLTKPLLDQIGRFDQVKRASYSIDRSRRDSNTPENITYSDDRLGGIPLVLAEEENPRSLRNQSFYRIAVGHDLIETGVGVTSLSGKLWIPRDTPLETVREYGGALLARVGATLDDMTRRGQIESVLAAYGITNLGAIGEVKPVTLRLAICDLASKLINMLHQRQPESPFAVSLTLASDGVPDFFNYPRLRFSDQSGDVATWRDATGNSELIKIRQIGQRISLEGLPSKEPIDPTVLHHPRSEERVEVHDPLAHLELTTTPRLITLLKEIISGVAGQIPSLAGVVSLPFVLASNTIRLDVVRAYGGDDPMTRMGSLEPEDIVELRPAMKLPAPGASQEPSVRKQLVSLGEKCVHMSDTNCRSCLSQKRYICLRSLIGHQFGHSKTLLLAHKGIELSDIQLRSSAGTSGKAMRIWGFAKLSAGKGGLTARNNNGAILLSQVMGQVDRGTFDVVAIVTPSTVNEDLRERLELICSIFRKKLVFLDYPALARMLAKFKDDAAFENLDFDQMQKDSRKKGAAAAKKKKSPVKKKSPAKSTV
jgi:hypothetical protein